MWQQDGLTSHFYEVFISSLGQSRNESNTSNNKINDNHDWQRADRGKENTWQGFALVWIGSNNAWPGLQAIEKSQPSAPTRQISKSDQPLSSPFCPPQHLLLALGLAVQHVTEQQHWFYVGTYQTCRIAGPPLHIPNQDCVLIISVRDPASLVKEERIFQCRCN